MKSKALSRFFYLNNFSDFDKLCRPIRKVNDIFIRFPMGVYVYVYPELISLICV